MRKALIFLFGLIESAIIDSRLFLMVVGFTGGAIIGIGISPDWESILPHAHNLRVNRVTSTTNDLALLPDNTRRFGAGQISSPKRQTQILAVDRAAPKTNDSAVPSENAKLSGAGQTSSRKRETRSFVIDQAAPKTNDSAVPSENAKLSGAGQTSLQKPQTQILSVHRKIAQTGNNSSDPHGTPSNLSVLAPPHLTTAADSQELHRSMTATTLDQSILAPPLQLRPVIGPYGERFSFAPPPGETRFHPNRMIWQISSLTDAEVARLAQSFGFQINSSEMIAGRRIVTITLPLGTNLRDIIQTLDKNSNISASPLYKFSLMRSAAVINNKGDLAQYVLAKFQLNKIHHQVTGSGVTIAVIDSEIDKRHIELAGAVSEELNTIDLKERPQAHGTAIAGSIVSHGRLQGVAPGAKILAICAFGNVQDGTEGTTLSVLRGLQWAISRGARIINMSFAGPRDPLIEHAIKLAYDKNIVLIAAAGNGGPESPPLYPGADPNVIAVTATDYNDRLFQMANQGPYVSLAAPGFEILASAPNDSYQLSTGTSIAAAHVSGVVALMLERNSTLTPDDVRRILESTAIDLGLKGRDNQFGWGLINPEKALELVGERATAAVKAVKQF